MGVRAKPKKLSGEQLWEYALRALGQRAHSIGEMRQKLLRRAETPPEVEATLTKLKEYKLIDDRAFSDTFATSRLEREGFGRFRVLRELRARRVAEPVAAEAIAKTYASKNEDELIGAFLERKYRNHDLQQELKDEKRLASVYRRLRTAGFSSSGSITALKKFSSSVQEWDEPAEPEEQEE